MESEAEDYSLFLVFFFKENQQSIFQQVKAMCTLLSFDQRTEQWQGTFKNKF